MSEQDDRQLIKETLDGNPEAFDELVRRYQDRVYTVLVRLCRHEHDAEDLTQEVFIKAYESLSEFRGRSEFFTWLYRIAANAFYSNCRHQRTHKVIKTIPIQRESFDENRAPELPPVQQRGPREIAAGNEILEVILKTINTLPEDQRMAVILKDVEGLECQEVADILDWPIGTVKSRLHRIRKELVERLKEVLEIPDGAAQKGAFE